MAPKVSESVEQLRAAGNQNFRNGQYGEASALYERALRLLQARDSVEELRAAGNQSFRNGQYADASALYERALRLLQARGSADPEEESVLYSNRAACYLKDGNCTDCIKDCTSALTLVPFSIKPLLRRASAYEALEKYTLAYVDYKTVLQIDNSVASALEGINRITRALMDSLGPEWRLKLPPIPVVPVSAQKRWNSLPSENHKETAKNKSKETTKSRGLEQSCVWQVKVDTHSKAGQALFSPFLKPRRHSLPLLDASVKFVGLPSAGDMERAKVLKEEGNELVKKGNHKKAIEKYSESLLFSSLESATYSNRALCHLVLKQYKEAVKDCTEALKLDGKNVKAFYRRAQAYKALKDYKSSLADISSLLQIEPRNGPAQKLRQEVNQNMN
ncbi:hypothetical protein U0070_019607 [Myodes glareolus]|uniref:Mitochondrial import receptor subunit TOM34 n=1 Tax=Myodes glareolus TaxID=447135 RepID=A0AAW0JMJ9_MYOGA